MYCISTAMVQESFRHPDHESITAVARSAVSKPSSVVRRKFAKPPVKVACLACRASRTRCDGQEPCANCAGRNRECSYMPSKRGGPRRRKKKSISDKNNVQHNGAQGTTMVPSPDFQEASSDMFGQIDELSMPGAGLRSLDYSSDVQTMFADLFVPNTEGHPDVHMQSTPSSSSIPMQPPVRTYGSEYDILNAYYVFIHSYFPILPPRVASPSPDKPLNYAASCTSSPSEDLALAYRPRSPLSLALSAILSLIPHPDDPEPSSPNSVIQRRNCAHAFAQMAADSVEADCELNSSSTDPSQGLCGERPSINREPFHHRTPVELENLLALLILSTYEYVQRGNLLKMRYRASQAFTIALDMSLHILGDDHSEFAEARRRAWWMTYYCVLQGSIVSTTTPSIVIQDPQFITPYPQFDSDPDGWSVLIQAQQVLVSATQFIIDLNKCIRSRSNISYIYERMQQLDAWAASVLSQSTLTPSISQPHGLDDRTELMTARSMRAIARIKLSSAQIKTHRFRAFQDIPIFVKKHCDLTAAAAANTNNTAPATCTPLKGPSQITNIRCSCTSSTMEHVPEYATPFTSTTPDLPSTSSSQQPPIPTEFPTECPFTSQHSAKVCLRAALLISHMFQSLPLPLPSRQDLHPHASQHQQQLPRTMPSFACCLMQGSYAMLMIFYKARVARRMSPPLPLPSQQGTGFENGRRMSGNMNPNSNSNQTPTPTDRLILELRQGLERIIGAVRNYTIAFEALVGMRDDIEGAYQTAFA